MLTLFLPFLMASCYEDKGNYDYYPINDVKISGIEKSYNINRWETLNITVSLENSLKKDAQMEYAWYLDGNKVADTKDLSYVISEKAKKYAARFEVTDTKNDNVRFFSDFEVYVHSQYSEGLMLLSECGDHPELAFYNTLNNPENKILNNLFELENKQALKGEGLRIEQPDLWAYGGVLFVHTTKGIHKLDPVLCKSLLEFSDASFSEKNMKFDMVYSTFEGFTPDFGVSLSTDGKIYPKLSRQDRFVPGSMKPIHVEGSDELMDYKLSPLALSSRDAALGYDEITGRFLFFMPSYDYPSYDENQYDVVRVSKTQIGLPWVYCGQNMDGNHFVSVFYDKDTDKAMVVPAHSRDGGIRGKDSLVVLNNHYIDAKTKYAINSATNLLYYTDGGNKIYTINISDPEHSFMSMEFPVALPADSKITMLKVAKDNLDLFVGVETSRNEKYNGDLYRISANDGSIVETLKRIGGRPIDVLEKIAVEYEE